jgi:hypothetical protein
MDLVEKHKDKYWVLTNISKMSRDALITLVTDNVKYSFINYDYFYCQFRSQQLHKIQTGKECDCHKTQYGKFVYGLYKHAQHCFFMSNGQLNEYKKAFPTMQQWPADKLLIQGSTFSEQSLKELEEIHKNRTNHNNKWAILKGGSWIKAEQPTVEYCKRNNIEYELIGGLAPSQFITKLSEFKGLIFQPAGFDTAPRLVIEAQLLGLELILGDYVQIKNDDWLTKSPNDLLEYLRHQKRFIWEKIKL